MKHRLKNFIIKVIDLLYIPAVKKFVPLQTFRYAICGGGNMIMDAILYFLFFQFLYLERDVNLYFVTISPQIAAFLTTAPITFLSGLWLAKNISFQNSPLRDRTQAIRYLLVTITNFVMKYFGIKLLVYLHVFPSISNAMMTVITVIFSYIMQKHFSFKGNNLN